MRLTGILRSWNDDRGYGFIAPTHGGAELFVHISAFSSDGSRPVHGESLTYELGRGANGKPQAVRVIRRAIGDRAAPRQVTVEKGSVATLLPSSIGILLILACVAYGYNRFIEVARQPQPVQVSPDTVEPPSAMRSPSFHCDGRTHCSQMTSCAEATYF